LSREKAKNPSDGQRIGGGRVKTRTPLIKAKPKVMPAPGDSWIAIAKAANPTGITIDVQRNA
jgi:hypothetical protein